MVNLRICIILVFVCKAILSSEPDLTVLIRRNDNDYNLTCVATGDETLHYAMTWIFNDLREYPKVQSVSKYAENIGFIDTFDHGYYLSKNSYVVKNSMEFKFPPVLDQRWEAFEEFSTDPEKKITNKIVMRNIPKLSVLHLSILVENEALFEITTNISNRCVFFSRANYSKLAEKYQYNKKCDVVNVNSDWYHYSFNEGALGNFAFQVSKMSLISPYKAIVKIHNYNFLRIPPNQNSRLFYENISLPFQRPLCLAFYIYMDYACLLEIKLCNDDCSQVYASKVWFGRGNWTQEKLVVQDLPIVPNAHLILNSQNNSAKCLIAIDNIRWCKLFDSRYMEIQSKSPNVSCASLKDTNRKISYKFIAKVNSKKDNSRYLGIHNNVTCLSVEKGEFCERQIICSAKDCQCSYGFCGKYCNTECPENNNSIKGSRPNPQYINVSKVTATTAQISSAPSDANMSNVVVEIGPSPISYVNVSVNGYILEANLTNLTPCTKYYVKVKFCADDECTIYTESRDFITKKCKGLSEANLNLETGSSNITLNIKDAVEDHCPPMFYLLRPSSLYNITLSIADRHIRQTEAKPLHISCSTKPLAPEPLRSFTIKDIKDTEGELDFNPPSKSFGHMKYIVSIKAIKNITCHKDTIPTLLYHNTPIRISDLHPYTKYNVSVILQNKECASPPTSHEFFTLPSEKISDEESVIDISNSNGAVTLPKCDVIRGPLFYNLTSTCLEIWCNEAKYNHTNFAYNESSKLKDFINNLTPFSKHRLEINVSRSISNKEQSSIKIPPLNITSPAGKPTKVSDAVAYPCNGSLCIKWKPPYPPTGDIDGYIVEVNNTEINHNCSLPHSNCLIIYDAKPNVLYNIQIIANNKDVTKLGSAVLINIIENTNITINVMKNCDVVLEWRHPFFTNINTTFKIKIAEIGNGDNNNETHDIAANNLVGNYTFTNLSMATVYYIQVEVHDSKFIAGPTSFQITTCDSPLTLEALTKGYAPHLIISTAVLIIVIMIILISIFMLIRRRKFMSMTNKRKDLEDFNLVQRDDKIVSQRTDYCQLMRTLVCNNMYLDLLGEEYKEVWDKMNIWYEIIFPNQFCSVVVEEEMHLNAHFVQGWRGENTYIAAQCPRGDYSVELFWNAVWDKNIRIIVSLLTKAEAELAMNKYWPEDMYKNTQETLEVRYVSSDFHTDYAIRKFAITKNNQELQVRHFNFFSFPFDDFPTYPTSFINFLKHIKGIDITSTPLLVHCGDGLGRTGVFIMSYNFMRCKESFVNIQKYLEDIRKCRPMLLNVFEQYQFVYYILHQIFADYYSSLTLTTFLGYDIHSINEKIHKDFDYLARTDYTYKMFRRKRKIPNEIKAAVVPGYENQCNYFAVPKVEKNDINRFWKYIMSSGIKMIIVLQNIDEQENTFWPSYGSSRSFDDILIQSKDHYKQNDIKIYKLSVLQKQQKEKTITLIYYKQWKSKSNVPTSEKDFYSLLKCYYALTVAEEDIILCCKDGLIGCGLFICADLILQKIKHEATFDLVWAVHGLKFIDKNFMKELDQHRFLYALAKYYLDVVENEDGYHEYSIVAQSTKVADVANIYDRIV